MSGEKRSVVESHKVVSLNSFATQIMFIGFVAKSCLTKCCVAQVCNKIMLHMMCSLVVLQKLQKPKKGEVWLLLNKGPGSRVARRALRRNIK